MANILETITNLLKRAVEGEPPPPAILQNIGAQLNDLTALSLDPSGDGIDRWLAKLREITGNTRMQETLIVRALQMKFPRLAEALTLLQIIGFEYDGDKPAAFSINWDELDALLSKPGDRALVLLLSKVQKLDDLKALQALILMLISAPQALLQLEYAHQGFTSVPVPGNPGLSLQELIALLQSPLGLPLPFALPLDLDQFLLQAKSPAVEGEQGSLTLNGPAAFDGLDDLGIDLHLKNVETAKNKTIDLGNGWPLTFGSTDTGDKHYRFQFRAQGLDTNVRPDGDFDVFLTRRPVDANALLIGEPEGTHFAIQSIRIGLRFHASGPLFDIVLKLEKIQFALKPDFLKFLSFGLNLPTLLSFDSDVDISYVQGQGLSGQGSAGGLPALGVNFPTPLNLNIGGSGAGLNVDQVVTRLEVAPDHGGLRFRVQFRYGAKAQFGPLNAVMDGAGVWLGRWTDGNGGLLPPQGIGLSLDASPVNGGGFLKIISDNEFAGALQLKILSIGAFAYGLYKTLPSGAPSFVVLIGIRLPLPGIQLGFGFAVSGFGGLVGVNRRADTDMLRERLASGASGDVLFNDDPMRNAPKLLGDMQQFFPDAEGVFLIGPTLQINWLLILKLDVGIFIEIGGDKFFIAGSARLVIGSEDFALVYLRMDFIGGIDFTKSLIFFDAALINSHVLGIFRITGGVALRIAYGSNSYFLFTVGGFHPSFNPGAMELPRVARVGVSFSLGPVWMKQEMYLAITSNTFQLGCKVEAGIEIGPISAHGWYGFDALIQFKPFHFVAHIEAGFDVEVAGTSLCSVRVEGMLSGPGPLVLQARASVRLLFIKVSGNVTIELSSNPPEVIIAIPNLPEHLRGELNNPDNLRIEGEDLSVIFAPHKEGSGKLFAPVGELIWEQKRAPLNLDIEKVEGIELHGWHRLTVTSHLGDGSREMDWFGMGTYIKLADSQALNTSTFTQQQSGMRIGVGEMSEGAFEEASIQISLMKLPTPFKFAELFTIFLYVNQALSSMLHERVNGAQLDPGKPGVAVHQEGWNAHDAGGALANLEPLNDAQAFVQAKQSGGIALPATAVALNLTGVL